MKTKTSLFAIIAIALFGCTKYDDTALKSDISSLMSRVQALEKRCDDLNSNITSLKSILDAVQKQKTITNVSSTTSGYVITFSDNQSITIKNGVDGSTPTISVRQDTDGMWYWTVDGNWLLDAKGNKIRANSTDGKDGVIPLLKIENDYWYISYNNGQSWDKLQKASGQDGSTPIISVRQDTDGMWYWTVDGNWILDANGNKIRANSTDGKDGVTPRLKIEDEYWYISYNNGQTWEKLQKATGEDGDAFFKSVDQDDKYVYIVLADGTTITLPKESAFALSFAKTEFHTASASMTIPFTVIAAGNDLRVVAFSDRNITVEVYMDGSASGHLSLTFIDGNYNGNVLVAAKSNGKTVTEILEFQEGVLSTSSNTEYWVETEGGEIRVAISRNMGVEIVPSVSWITVKPQTRALIQENLSFEVAPNETYQNRDGAVTIKGEEGLLITFTIHQAQKDYLKLDKTSATILDDESFNLGYTTNMSGTVTWSSSNPNVATVDANGLVTAVSKGETTITVQSENGKCSDSCKVTVKRFSDGISVSCSGGAFRITNTLILYGSTMNWTVRNSTGHTVMIDSVYLVDGETGSQTGTLDLSKELATGSSASWGISVPLVGIHYPVTAVFNISYNGKSYKASGVYSYSSPW